MENTPLDGTAVGPKETLQAWERTYIAQQYRIDVARTTIGDTLRSLRGSFGHRLWGELNAICDAIDARREQVAPGTMEPTATGPVPTGQLVLMCFRGLVVGTLTLTFAWLVLGALTQRNLPLEHSWLGLFVWSISGDLNDQGGLPFIPPFLVLLLAIYWITREERRALGGGLLVSIFAAPLFLLFIFLFLILADLAKAGIHW